MKLLKDKILNKDEELVMEKNKVITSMLIVVLRHLPCRYFVPFTLSLIVYVREHRQAM